MYNTYIKQAQHTNKLESEAMNTTTNTTNTNTAAIARTLRDYKNAKAKEAALVALSGGVQGGEELRCVAAAREARQAAFFEHMEAIGLCG